MGKVSTDYVRWLPKAEPSDLFPYAYNLYWIKSIDELKQILSQPTDYLAFDTETTGLNQEELDIVGYSFCLDGKNAYYVPVNHYSFELGLESIDLIYNKMCNTKKVGMFNMRFDVRVLEYVGFKEQFNAINDKDFTNEFNELVSQCSRLNKKCPYDNPTALKEEYKLKLSNLPYYRYDMSKINIEDVQAIVYLVDTNVKYPSLKESEEWYLGWRGASFESTVSKAEDSRAITLKKNNKTGELEIKDMNFYYLTPEEAYEYAAIDALGTYLLGIKLQPFLQAAKTSGYLDIHCLMPLTRFENDLTLIDIKRLNEYSTYLDTQIKECQKRCWTTAGEEFNIGSGKETNKILKKLNINTGVYTKRGDMSTSKDSIKNCLDKLDKNDPHRQFLQDLTNYGTLIKQKSSYVDNIIDMATSNIYHKNRLRFSYKTCEVPSGRLAAGGDKKNSFFANCVTGDTLLFTTEGLKQISDIKVGDFVWDGFKFTEVLNFWNRGIKPVYKVTLSNGMSIKCTNDHKIYSIVDNEIDYFKLSKLSVGCPVAVNGQAYNTEFNNIEKTIDIERPKGGLQCKIFDLDLSNPDLYFLFGYMLGDGCISNDGHIYLYFNYTTKVDAKIRIINILNKYNMSFTEKQTGNNLCTITISHASFHRWILSRGFKTDNQKVIPNFIFSANFKCRCEYFRGLYTADGKRINSNNNLTIRQLYNINEISLLLNSIGVSHNIKHYKDCDQINITNYKKFAELIGYEGLSDDIKSNLSKVTGGPILPKSLVLKYKSKRIVKNVRREKSGYTRKTFDYRNNSYLDTSDENNLRLLWYEILSIEKIDDSVVYDIETNSHTFIGNGISLHNCNIQNITKPHVTNHFAIPESACEKYYPDVWQALNDSGTREECRNPLYFIDKDKILKLCIDNNSNLNLPKDATRWCYRIYGWVFSDFPWLIPNVQELVVEGFIQDLNIRSTFLPDDGYFWVSLDFNAEEIRIPAIWSREPAWVDAFSHNKDVHKSTAIAIWGEENYNKDKRKKAKRG